MRGENTLGATLRGGWIVVALCTAGAGPVSPQTEPQTEGRSVLGIVAYAAGGALVGGWAGYMASQVTWSDWRAGTGRSAHRIRFSVAGAALGLVAGIMISRRGAGAAPALAEQLRVSPYNDTRPITADEIRTSQARSVTELLRALRPQWLRSRGADVLRPNSDPLAVHGVRVYLNGGLLGGLETLDQVSVYTVTGVQFFDAAAAILRWGAGNDDGAILLLTGPAS